MSDTCYWDGFVTGAVVVLIGWAVKNVLCVLTDAIENRDENLDEP